LPEAILVAGEMKRWDETQPSTETLQRFEEAEHTVEALVRSVPPGRPHTTLVWLLREFAEAKTDLKESPEVPS
jgi:hypothetical protein